jgi:hypothetical protein
VKSHKHPTDVLGSCGVDAVALVLAPSDRHSRNEETRCGGALRSSLSKRNIDLKEKEGREGGREGRKGGERKIQIPMPVAPELGPGKLGTSSWWCDLEGPFHHIYRSIQSAGAHSPVASVNANT